jgi:peptidoglycan/xylan/chitin deacetylase (PgdA/CDA1 family)
MPRALSLKKLKQTALGFSKALGVFTVMKNSEWRRRRLLIVCYHGISIDNEHEWNPSLYMKAGDLARRFEALRAGRYNVLPLGEAVRRLYARDLPPRSVAITFDDGYYDFYKMAWPLLQQYELPATVYLTTLRCDRNAPIFNLALSYMLWKARGRRFDASSLAVGPLDLRTTEGRTDAWKRIMRIGAPLPIEHKGDLARRVGEAIGVDYTDIERRRLLTIMTPAEVAESAARGVDFELHTHRHRTPAVREEFADEIETNRARITQLTGSNPTHFCYPSGVYDRRFLPWLSEQQVVSATTCDAGFATPSSEALLLPRLVDHEGLAPIEFEGWLTGAAAVTGRKRGPVLEGY